MHFDEMNPDRPDYDVVADRYAELESLLDDGNTTDAVRGWDLLRRELGTWGAIARLHFAQNTQDAEAKREREFADEFFPRVAEFEVEFKRRLLAMKDELQAELGDHVFELWKADIAAFEPSIEQDLVEQSKTGNERTELVAGAEIEFEGESYTLSQLRAFSEDPDRDRRERATRANWAWYGEQGDVMDDIFDRLVTLRHSMAGKLGFDNFVPLGYLSRQRIDYGAGDVATFREEVRTHVVPLASRIVERQADILGIDQVMAWDEKVFSPGGAPRPQADYDELVSAAHRMFEEMDPELANFFSLMDDRGLMDLKSRRGKASGGFCTSLENYGVPFIFANFNGTRGDVEVFTHEMGHAFQCYLSMDKFPIDTIWPTLESCEIHSMSLEFLCWPQMEQFFGDDADRFRWIHLAESLMFLPYGVAVDHFQHLVYERPEATPAERREMWLEMEAMYLPWKNWGDLEHPSSGGRWHAQSHIYGAPFYYIDYVLAMTCALQFWERMNRDRDAAMKDYIALCRRGGEAPFQSLAKSAGLRSPFERGCLADVVDTAHKYLDL